MEQDCRVLACIEKFSQLRRQCVHLDKGGDLRVAIEAVSRSGALASELRAVARSLGDRVVKKNLLRDADELEEKTNKLLTAFLAFGHWVIDTESTTAEREEMIESLFFEVTGRASKLADWIGLVQESLEKLREPLRVQKKSLSKEKANQVAMTLAQRDPKFLKEGHRVWAKLISKEAGRPCSASLAKSTDFWAATVDKMGRGRMRGQRKPNAIANSQKALNVLAAQQAADFEPSPLDKNPAKVRSTKRV